MKKGLVLAVLTILMLIYFYGHPGFVQSSEELIRNGQTSSENKEEGAESVGLEKTKSRECLDSGRYTKKIHKDMADGKKIGITESPTFLLGFPNESEDRVKVAEIMKGAQFRSVFKVAVESPLVSAPEGVPAKGRIFYVRQTVGDDANDGLSPQTAWRHIAKLSDAMRAGDTAYVGPGLYREQVTVYHEGTADNRLTFIADTTGQHTGDPPGVVMVSGAEPLDTSIFAQSSPPGVYTVRFPNYPVLGVVEMDGAQYRYMLVRSKKEFPEGTSLPENYPFDTIAKTPSSFSYDADTQALYIHTSDGKPPGKHEIELIRRSSGFFIFGKRYVTVIGFTFRHMGDAGIDFWRGADNGIAINNTAYGSRQGIRVLESPNILLYGNILFRNENAGAYFLRESLNCVAIGNTAYDNVKGLRWGSRSLNGLVIGNALFDNSERGLAIEETDGVIVRQNRLANNAKSQLLVLQSVYGSEDNCFENGNPEQLTADFSLLSFIREHYKTLAEYQNAKRQDLDSREGGCRPLPQKIDVIKLHKETMAYAEPARKMLRESSEKGIQKMKDTKSGPNSGSDILKKK